MTTKLKPRKRGPVVIEGDFEIFDAQGRRLPISDRSRAQLCRCGASRTTPLCDGSHDRVGFHPDNERE